MGTVGVLFVAAAVAGGCGGTKNASAPQPANDEASVRQVLGQLQKLSVAGDGKAICNEIFTPKLADSVTTSAKSGSCATEVKDKLFSPSTKLDVKNVSVKDSGNATAVVEEANGNTSTVLFVRQSGRWRIRSVEPA